MHEIPHDTVGIFKMWIVLFNPYSEILYHLYHICLMHVSTFKKNYFV